jgi:hypothetical protein
MSSDAAAPAEETETAANPRPLDLVDLEVDDEGWYIDGHGERSYILDEATLALHHVAIANGWEHSYDRTPYDNLRALLEKTAEYELERDTVDNFAFALIAALGPKVTSRALDRLADEGVPVPGGEGE